MNKEKEERLTENLIEVKEFCDKYPLNAGWAWASKRLGAALDELNPKEEPEPGPPKEAEKPAAMPKTEAEQIAEVTPVPVEPVAEPKPEPSTPLPEPSGTDSEKERMTKKEEE